MSVPSKSKKAPTVGPVGTAVDLLDELVRTACSRSEESVVG